MITITIPELKTLPKINSVDDMPYHHGGRLSLINKNLPHSAGIYFLFKKLLGEEEELVYIGQTQNIRARVSFHMTYKKPFNVVSFLLEENPLLRKAKELIYCDKYKPDLNYFNNQYGGNI